MIVNSVAESAFQQALKTYKEQLTEKELARIDVPTSMADLVERGKTIGMGDRKALRLLETLESTRVHLVPFQDLLQGVCKLSPKGGDLIWASVKFVFDTVKNVHSSFIQALEFLVTMSEKMRYIGSLESTFGDKPLVKTALESLYVAILGFWIEAVKHYRTTFAKTAFKTALSGSITKKFETLKGELEKQEARLTAAAAAQHYSDDATHWEQASNYFKTERVAKLVSWIAAPSFEVDFKRADQKRHSGTCKWILDREKFKIWRANSMGAFLVIYGIPGAGKTILSSFLITDAASQAASQLSCGVVLYHYFKADDNTKNTPLSAMRSLLQQLYDYLIRIGGNVLSAFEEELRGRANRPTTDFDVMWGIFHATVVSHKLSVTLILDAIDECVSAKPFVRELQKLSTTEIVRIVVTGRKTGVHVDEFAKAASTEIVEMTEDDVKHDIASFVEYKINKIERLQSSRDVRLRSNVIAELGKVENHKGMFLWAYLMCKDVKDQISVPAIWNLMKKLPKGLDDVYAKILKKLSELPPDLQNFSRLVLRWIVGSSRPLKFEELEQALRIANPDDQLFDDEEDDGDYGLRWSRKDIVRVCGSLVSYTGLDDGDMIRVIHLSTRDFLKSSPDVLELPDSCAMFLVDVLEAGLTLGQACIDFLSATNLHKDTYFKQREILFPKQELARNSCFNHRYPLFDYAVIYWPEYALDCITDQQVRSSISFEIKKLECKISSFLKCTFSILWLEEYIRQVGAEFAHQTVNRLALQLGPGVAMWLPRAIEFLDSYGKTVSRKPQIVYSCLESPGNHRVQRVRAFEEEAESYTSELWKFEKSWVHYEPAGDSLFATERTVDTIRLNRQIIGLAMRFRPAASLEEQSPNGQWVVRSAAASYRGTFVAVTFCPQVIGGNSSEMFYRTICWSIITTSDSSIRSTNDWAEVAFIDRLDGPGCSVFRDPIPNLFWGEGRGSVVSFGDNNTLLAPGGIWNILTEQRISRPAAIYEPDPSLDVANTCFSGNGARAARVNNHTEIEVLDISGTSILKHSFPSGTVFSEQVIILAFSRSGNKLVIFFKEPIGSYLNHRRICFNVESDKCMELPMAKVPRIQFPQFTRDERKIIARLPGIKHSDSEDASQSYHGGSSIVVWALGDDEAHMVYLFKSFDTCLTFSILPARDASIAIATSDGEFIVRKFAQQWSTEEESKLLGSRKMLSADGKTLGIVTDNGQRILVAICSRIHQESPALLVESWPLVGTSSRITGLMQRLKPSASNSITLSPNGGYISAKSELFSINNTSPEAHGILEPVTLPLDSADELISVTFNEDETSLACIVENQSICLSIYSRENLDSSQWKLKASHFVSSSGSMDPQSIGVTFYPKSSSLLAFSYWDYNFRCGAWLAEITEEGELVTTEIIDEYLADIQFSLCGNYVYNVNRNVKRDEIVWPIPYTLPSQFIKQKPSRYPSHPISMNKFLAYISYPNMFRIRGDEATGILFLDHKVVNQDQYRSKVICVIPDEFTYTTHSSTIELTLIWPLESRVVDEPGVDEVKVLIRPQEVDKMRIIETGIMSGELLEDGDGWFEACSTQAQFCA